MGGVFPPKGNTSYLSRVSKRRTAAKNPAMPAGWSGGKRTAGRS